MHVCHLSGMCFMDMNISPYGNMCLGVYKCKICGSNGEFYYEIDLELEVCCVARLWTSSSKQAQLLS